MNDCRHILITLAPGVSLQRATDFAEYLQHRYSEGSIAPVKRADAGPMVYLAQGEGFDSTYAFADDEARDEFAHRTGYETVGEEVLLDASFALAVCPKCAEHGQPAEDQWVCETEGCEREGEIIPDTMISQEGK